MISYILWALLIYFLYVATPALLRLTGGRKGLGDIAGAALGPRDDVTETTTSAKRAARAQRNMEESLFFFIPLALLLMHTGKADGIASAGAGLYIVARALYLPSYLMGVFGMRTAVWVAGFVGIAMMAVRAIISFSLHQ